MTSGLPKRKRRNISNPIALLAIGLFFLLDGIALIALGGTDPIPKALAETTRIEGHVDDADLSRTSRNGSRRLRLTIKGHRYMLSAGRADVERVNREVSIGDAVTVYSTPIMGGEDRIWQLESKDRILQPFQPMRNNAATRNERMTAIGSGLAWFGAIIALIGVGILVLKRQVRVTVSVNTNSPQV